MADTIESLQAQVAALTAENASLKAAYAHCCSINYALGHRNSHLEQAALTALAVVEENYDLQSKLRHANSELARVEQARQDIISAVREGLPKRR
jgi:FtsZ-binding cell division protein ZapB